MRKVILFVVSLLLYTGQLYAGWYDDFVIFGVRGNVVTVDVYKDATTGVYKFTKLWLSVVPEDPTLFADNSPFVVNCDGKLGGDLFNCTSYTPFLGSSSCVPIQHTTFPSFFVGHPINSTVIVDRYNCKPGASFGAGECVEFSGTILHVFTQASGNQVLWPWVKTIDWFAATDCTPK